MKYFFLKRFQIFSVGDLVGSITVASSVEAPNKNLFYVHALSIKGLVIEKLVPVELEAIVASPRLLETDSQSYIPCAIPIYGWAFELGIHR